MRNHQNYNKEVIQVHNYNFKNTLKTLSIISLLIYIDLIGDYSYCGFP